MDQRTIATYDRTAVDYTAATWTYWSRFSRTFFDEFIRVANGTVLDLGSGPGRDALVFRAAGLDTVCFDASREMVRLAAGYGLTAVRGEFLHLPFAPTSFNAVWAYCALLHLPKDVVPSAISEIGRVLRTGGLFAIGMVEGTKSGYKRDAKGNARWISRYERSELAIMLKSHGFEAVYEEAVPVTSNVYLTIVLRKR